MSNTVIWCTIAFSMGTLFLGIGIYAKRCKKPMWFWAGTEVSPDAVSDMVQYNNANARMWWQYSLWFWASGIAKFLHSGLAVALLILGCTLGIVLLVCRFLAIEKKYTRR